jgi:MFS family permease
MTREKSKLSGILPILLFLPLIVFLETDLVLFVANQVLIAAEFNLGAQFTVIGFITGFYFIVKAVFILIAGYLSDIYKRKWLLIFAGGIWVISEILTSFVANPLMLGFFRITAAIGLGAASPVTLSLLADIFSSEKRGNSFAWWGLATTLGALIGGSFSFGVNTFIDYEFPENWTVLQKIDYIRLNFPVEMTYWRLPFLWAGLIGLALLCLCFFIKEPKRASKESALEDVLSDENIDYTHSYRIKLEDLKGIFTKRSNFWLIINFFDTILYGFLVSYLITYITVEVGFSFTDPISILMVLVFIAPIGVSLFVGQFYFARLGDKKVAEGDPAGRVKVAIFCGLVHIPFLILGFMFFPNAAHLTFLKGALDLSNALWLFWIILLVMSVIIGIGMFLEFGVGPCWFASMVDVNLPEHRGTAYAMASMMDAIGRGIGPIVGSLFVDYYISIGEVYPFGMTILVTTLSFGVISSILWIPIYKYCNKDFAEVAKILKDRAEELKKLPLVKAAAE